MDLKTAVKDFWVNAQKQISGLYGVEVWEKYYAHNNTAKLIAVAPFVDNQLNPDRLAYASLVLLWAAKKVPSIAGMRTASDFYDRLEILPVFSQARSHALTGMIANRAAKDFRDDFRRGKYKENPLLGQLTENDLNAVVEDTVVDETTPTALLAKSLVAELGGDIDAKSTYTATADGALATAYEYW